MSAEDNFEIVLKGVGGHAARPHWGNEVLVAACAMVMNLQTIVSRRLSPTDIGVVSVTELITDGTRNALAWAGAHSWRRPQLPAGGQRRDREADAHHRRGHGAGLQRRRRGDLHAGVRAAAERRRLGGRGLCGRARRASPQSTYQAAGGADDRHRRILPASSNMCPAASCSSATARIPRRCTTRPTISTTTGCSMERIFTQASSVDG